MAAGPAGNQRLGQLMSDAGFTSHKAFARAIRLVAAQSGRPVGCDHTSVSRWLHGMTPRADTAACITAVLSRGLGRPVSLADAGLTSSAAVPPDLGLDFTSPESASVEEAARLWRADLDDARVIMRAAPSAAAWQAIPLAWLVSSSAYPGATPSTRPKAGMADVERLRATTDLFAELDGNYGGGHARRALIRYLDDEVERLLHGEFTDTVGAALFSAAAQATLLAGWMSYDSGLHGLAQRYFIQALRMAEAGNDRLLGGSILDAMSHQATFLGRFSEAVNLARAARAGTGNLATPSLAAHFSAMEARALAGHGDRRGCHLALSEAERAFQRRSAGSDPDWFQYFDDAELAAEFGHCLRDLGEFPGAASHAQASIGASGGPRSDFFVTLVLADSYRGAGEIELACQTAMDAMNQGDRLRSARCARYVRDFRARLAPVASAAVVRQLNDEAAGFAIWQVAGGGTQHTTMSR
jgi:hypothetical protein